MGAVVERQDARPDAWIGRVVGPGMGVVAAAAVVGLASWEGRLRDQLAREPSAEPIWVWIGPSRTCRFGHGGGRTCVSPGAVASDRRCGNTRLPPAGIRSQWLGHCPTRTWCLGCIGASRPSLS